MRILTRSFLSLPVVCLAAGTLWAANDPFTGKWKVNSSRSRLTDEMKVAVVGGNKYDITFGPGAVDTVIADGTDQTALRGTTLAVTVESPNHWTVVRKKDGHTLLIANWTLSGDGNTLDDAYTGYQADGSTSNLHYVYRRTGGGAGFPGTWDSVSEEVSVFELEIRPYEGDGLSFDRFAMRIGHNNMKFDGKDYPYAEKELAGYTSSGRRVNQRSIEITDKFQGRISRIRQIEVSMDLKTMTMTMRQPGTSKREDILVFERE